MDQIDSLTEQVKQLSEELQEVNQSALMKEKRDAQNRILQMEKEHQELSEKITALQSSIRENESQYQRKLDAVEAAAEKEVSDARNQYQRYTCSLSERENQIENKEKILLSREQKLDREVKDRADLAIAQITEQLQSEADRKNKKAEKKYRARKSVLEAQYASIKAMYHTAMSGPFVYAFVYLIFREDAVEQYEHATEMYQAIAEYIETLICK